MSPDPRQSPERQDGVGPPASYADRSRSDGEGTHLDRLPPPAFPPGSRRLALRRSGRSGGGEDGSGGGLPDDAFIAPDEPIVRASPAADDAFISPDEPLPPRGSRTEDDGVGPTEVVVTGIGDDPHLDTPAPGGARRFADPDVGELVEQVGRLADALRERGEAGLRTAPGMSRFEATLRAYCVGWLAARREGAEGG